ncbi:MAG: ATP-dependent Clp protease proteolytic subunit [Myxococcota bacterium]
MMNADSLPESNLPESNLREGLFRARTVLVSGEIDPAVAARVNGQLFALAAINDQPIRMFVSSPGGHVESGDSIHDVVGFIEPEVIMIGSGWVASAAALLYVGVPRTRRLALPNTRFMLHQPAGAVQGRAADVEIEAEQILAVRARLNRLFAAATGQPEARIRQDTDRNHWMGVQEAKAYGLVGRIVRRASEVEVGELGGTGHDG